MIWGRMGGVLTPPSTETGPWRIAPDVAWTDGEHRLVLALRAPYTALPLRLTESAAVIWDLVADGLDLDGILRELADIDDPGVEHHVRTFLADLRRRELIQPAPD